MEKIVAASPEPPAEEVETLRKALERSIVALDDWLNLHAPDECNDQRVKEARERISKAGTLAYIAEVQSFNRAALARARAKGGG